MKEASAGKTLEGEITEQSEGKQLEMRASPPSHWPSHNETTLNRWLLRERSRAEREAGQRE
jgi:hypothetical protein